MFWRDMLPYTLQCLRSEMGGNLALESPANTALLMRHGNIALQARAQQMREEGQQIAELVCQSRDDWFKRMHAAMRENDHLMVALLALVGWEHGWSHSGITVAREAVGANA